MRNISVSAAAFAAILRFLVLVKVSDSASVSIITTTDVSPVTEESLSSSYIPSVQKMGSDNGKVGTQEKKMWKSLVLPQFLRDSTTSSFPCNDDDTKGYSSVLNQSRKIVGKTNMSNMTATTCPPSSNDNKSTTVTKKLKSNINTASNTNWSSPLHVARCRVTCLEKFQPSKSESVKETTEADSVSQEEYVFTTAELHHVPPSREKRSSNRVLERKSWLCVQSSSDCSSCWKNCGLVQVLENGDTEKTAKPKQNPKQETVGVHPVVATKHQYSLKITQRKLSWPAFLTSSPVVYVVMREYPDRNWRQIAQTIQTEIAVRTDATSSEANIANVSSIRVLVVDKSRLRLVYNPVKARELEQTHNSIENLANNSPNGLKTTATKFRPPAASPATTNETTAISHDTPKETNPFEVRVVSLIHQTSLVIAELRWNAVGESLVQEYLITWELSGGGLKGHLVTDSTSVSLSLWPETSYTIRVKTFQQGSLGLDGEHPNVPELQSLPLTVDTSEASFPLEQSSAFLLDMDTEDENERNLSVSRGRIEKLSVALGRIQPITRQFASFPEHHFTGLLNMTLMTGFTISVLLFILVILIVTAFTWTRMRSIDNYSQWRPTSPDNLDEWSSSPILSPARNQNEYKYPMNHCHYNNAWAEDCHYPRCHEECGAFFGLEETSSHGPCSEINSATGIFGEMFEHQKHSSVAVISLHEKSKMQALLTKPTFSAEAPPYFVFSGEREKADSPSYSRLVEDSCTFPRE